MVKPPVKPLRLRASEIYWGNRVLFAAFDPPEESMAHSIGIDHRSGRNGGEPHGPEQADPTSPANTAIAHNKISG